MVIHLQIFLGLYFAPPVCTVLQSLLCWPIHLFVSSQCGAWAQDRQLKYSYTGRLPYWYAQVTGGQVRFAFRLHKKYGPVVRIAPNELSYVDEFGGKAFQDGEITTWVRFLLSYLCWRNVSLIVAGYEKGRLENGKFQIYHALPQNGVPNMGAADLKDHTRVRKIFCK